MTKQIKTERKANIWIEHNPTTGIIKPWEVLFQADGGPVWVSASCKTQESAEKSVRKTIACNDQHKVYELARK